MRTTNWFALAAGALALVLTAASQVVPWWQIKVGSLATMGWSPVNLSISILGLSLVPPLITLINIIFVLILVASGIVLIIYSVLPTKPYAKHMLGFAYKKPLAIFIAFMVGLLLLTNIGTILAVFLHGSLGSGLQISSLNPQISGTKTINLALSSGSRQPRPGRKYLHPNFNRPAMDILACSSSGCPVHRRPNLPREVFQNQRDSSNRGSSSSGSLGGKNRKTNSRRTQ